MKRLKPILGVFALILPLLHSTEVMGKVYMDIYAPSGSKLPMAIQEFPEKKRAFSRGEGESAEKISRILRETLIEDLNFANFFQIIDKEAYIEDASNMTLEKRKINFSNWRTIGAELLIKGNIQIKGKVLTAELRLFDAVREGQLLGKKRWGGISDPEMTARRIAHKFADDIMKALTGTPSIFSTKLLFVSKRSGNKEIYSSDYNGGNVRQLTRNRSINLSPRWSPDGRKLLYTSFRRGWACLYILDLKSGRTTTLSCEKGANTSGRWSPKGDQVALSLSKDTRDGSSEIYIKTLSSGSLLRITRNRALDVSPTWSPDGKRLAYVSDMAGNPHIYVINSTGGKAKRITFKGTYNASPVWSPDGKSIVFSRAIGGKFTIWTMDADGRNERQLTTKGSDKSPAWSPDGRYIMFDREIGGVSKIYMMRADGSGLTRIKTRIGGEMTPSWSPYLK